jgi:hypothetical protein
MEKDRICPFMSTGDQKVSCLRDECQVWFREEKDSESSLSRANCALAYLPQLVLEVATHTRLIRASTEDSIVI